MCITMYITPCHTLHHTASHKGYICGRAADETPQGHLVVLAVGTPEQRLRLTSHSDAHLVVGLQRLEALLTQVVARLAVGHLRSYAAPHPTHSMMPPMALFLSLVRAGVTLYTISGISMPSDCQITSSRCITCSASVSCRQSSYAFRITPIFCSGAFSFCQLHRRAGRRPPLRQARRGLEELGRGAQRQARARSLQPLHRARRVDRRAHAPTPHAARP